MLKRTILVVGSVGLLSACSLLGSFGYEPAEPADRNVAKQDPYWQRFYELEQEIAQLRLQLDKKSPEAASSEPTDKLIATAANEQNSASRADAFLERLRASTDTAIASIDRALASIQKTAKPTLASDHEVVDEPNYSEPQVENDIVAGSLQRGSEGEVVSQVTYSQPRQAAYNYSVVYVYPEPQPWDEMWAKLEQAQELDKWRGSNPDKPSYFIYVGAYLKQADAIERQQMLMGLVGEGPELRANHNTAIAAK